MEFRVKECFLLIEGGGPSYGINGGNLNSRRPGWLNGTSLSRVDVPGLYSTIFSNGGHLTCGALTNAYGGCTIGGSSAINAGLFFQPPASDWDHYFPERWKSIDVQNATQRLYTKQHSTDSSSVNGRRYLQDGYNAMRGWLVEGLGFKEVDINAQVNDKTEVFGHPIYDYVGGQRGGPVITYLQEALKRPNLHLQSGVRVVRIERDGNTATGVKVLIKNTETCIRLSSKGRVIVSAGAIQSPSLLMFSGIGDPTTLTTLSEAGKLDPKLPSGSWINSSAIGSGLFDNPNTYIELQSPSLSSYTYKYSSPPATDTSLYLKSRSGPYSFAGQTAVFWDTDANNVGFQGTLSTAGYRDYTGKDVNTLNIYGTTGLSSRGAVILSPDNSGNYIPGPDNNVYYSAPSDAEAIATFIHKIFQGLNSTDITPLNLAQNSSIEEIWKYITTYSPYARGEVNHWSSSCRIGSCVDENLRVVGMKNLHVVDASVLEPLTVNPQMGVMIAAERGAELILELDGIAMS